MRWKKKPKTPYPKNGETRSRKVFLLFPLTLNYETRWLEFAWIAERYVYGYARWPDARAVMASTYKTKYASYGKWEKISWLL